MRNFIKTNCFPSIFLMGFLLFSHFLELFCQHDAKTVHQKTLFQASWNFNYQTKSYAAQVPGSIYTDLLHNQLIKDPFFGCNEDSLQWVSQQEWVYSAVFDKSDIPQNIYNELVFNGINGYALLFLNGKPLLRQEGDSLVNFTDNAFRMYRFRLPKSLKKSGNILTVKFLPSHKIIAERAAHLAYELPDNRAFLRTPPYQSGWDWGPALPDCGFQKPIEIDSWRKIKIDDIQIYTNLIENRAQVTVRTDITAVKPCHAIISYYLNDTLIKIQEKVKIAGTNTIDFTTNITHPKLWNPNGTGDQPLYRIRVEVSVNKEIDKIEKRFGLRTIALDTRPDSIGTAFAFTVNGRPIFMKGANWIPADFFPHRVTPDKYRALLQSCKNANINMLRVWGGGIYEDDYFYDLCDELGILVWQDFMFACALYPACSTFLQNVATEAKEQILRLRNHPSIALWCGNNEVKNGWEDWGWQTQYNDQARQEIDRNQKLIFNELLAQQVQQYDAARPYHASSPLWGWGHKECFTEGDSHYWGVWWGEEPFEVWKNKVGRFMSEFGFQSYPQMSVIEQFTNKDERRLNSSAMQNHQKHARGMALIGSAMQQYFYEPDNLADFLYISQLTQALGTGQALEVFRMKMPYCMGALYWQLNDCWPVASWSSIDFYGNWKALHYETARQYRNIIIACDTFCHSGTNIYIVNDNLSDIVGICTLELTDFQGNLLSSENIALTAKGNNSNYLTYYQLNEKYENRKESCFLRIIFKDNNFNILAEKVHFFLYPNALQLKPCRSAIVLGVPEAPKGKTKHDVSHFPHIESGDNLQTDFSFICETDTTQIYVLTLSSPCLKYGVAVEADAPCRFSDNYFLLMPDEEKKITITIDTKPASPTVTRFDIRSFGK